LQTLGRASEALATYRVKLAQLNPNAEPTQRELALAYYKLGDAQAKLGQVDDALMKYRASLAAADAEMKTNSSLPGLRRQLGQAIVSSCADMGSAYVKFGKSDFAHQVWSGGRDIFRYLMRKDPGEQLKTFLGSINKLRG
jgi:tetratricopeptide (TPR) repeat protein